MADNPYPINVGRQLWSQVATSLASYFFSIIVVAIAMIVELGSLGLFFILPLMGFLILMLVISIIYTALYLNAISYSVEDKQFGMKGGIIARYEKVLPYSKIQHIILTRSLMQRIMGLSSIIIQTAAPNQGINYSSGSRNKDPFAGSPRIPGLNSEDAEKLRDYIIAQVLRSKSGQGLG